MPPRSKLPVAAQQASTVQWWKQSRENVAVVLSDVFRVLYKDQESRRARLIDYFRLYGNFNSRGVSAGLYNRPKIEGKNSRLTYNLIQSSIDTVNAKLAKNRPRATFTTKGGSYSERKKAKQLDSFVEGGFYQARVYETTPIVQRDSCIFGTGSVKIFEDAATKRVVVERAFIDELFVDDLEAVYGKPRSMYQRRVVSREVMLGLYGTAPEDATKAEKDTAGLLRNMILAAPLVEEGHVGKAAEQAELIEVVEGWHLPSGRVPDVSEDATPAELMDGHDGRHTIVIPDAKGGTIIFDAWRKSSFPFAFLHWTEPVRGFWGQGAADQLMGLQVEVNKVLRILQLSADFCIPKLIVDRSSKVTRAHLDDLIGGIIEGNFSGSGAFAPRMETWNGISPQLLEHLDRCVRQAYEIIGVSLMSAAGRKPSGLESGRALREFHDIETERFATAARGYENFHIEIARQFIECARDIAARDGEYEVVATRRHALERIDWADIDLASDSYVMRALPTSALPSTPAGKLDTVTDWLNLGLIEQEDMIRLLDFPDLETVSDALEASAEFISMQIEDMVEKGIARTPHPYSNLVYATKAAKAAYLNAMRQDDVPAANRDLLRNYILSALDMIQKATPPAPAPMGPAMQQPGLPPGAALPPGPPGMMAPPPGGGPPPAAALPPPAPAV